MTHKFTKNVSFIHECMYIHTWMYVHTLPPATSFIAVQSADYSIAINTTVWKATIFCCDCESKICHFKGFFSLKTPLPKICTFEVFKRIFVKKTKILGFYNPCLQPRYELLTMRVLMTARNVIYIQRTVMSADIVCWRIMEKRDK